MDSYKIFSGTSLATIICLLLVYINRDFKMNNFYVILPSNTNVSGNKTGDFIVRLPEKLNFSGNWEVALVEFSYPFSWNNIGVDNVEEETTIIIYLLEDIDTRNYKELAFQISPGQYDSIKTLCDNMNKSFNNFALKTMNITKQERLSIQKELDKMKNVPDDDKNKIVTKRRLINPFYEKLLKLKNGFEIKYDELQKKAIVDIDKDIIATIKFPKRLAYILGGFSKNNKSLNGYIYDKHSTADYPPDLTGGVDTMYLYCNIVQPQIVGNIRAQLLRTVKIEGKYGETINKVFYTPHYLQLSEKEFDTIQINVKTDTNQTMPFQFGKVVVKLHFRKLSILNV